LRGIVSGPFVNTFFERERMHYVALFVNSIRVDGEPKLLEPEKCAGWRWFDWYNLPNPLFKPLATLLSTAWTPPIASRPLGSPL
jgi:8-oxo-dGTP diphosphatase